MCLYTTVTYNITVKLRLKVLYNQWSNNSSQQGAKFQYYIINVTITINTFSAKSCKCRSTKHGYSE